jgi:hypothetical protein
LLNQKTIYILLFYSAAQAIKFLNKRYSLYHNAVKQAFETANKIAEDFDAKKIFSAYRSQLEAEGVENRHLCR